MVFGKRNCILLVISVGIIILGLLLMSGRGSTDSTEFTAKIFSICRIVVTPIVTLVGLLLIIYTIIIKPKDPNKSNGRGSDAKPQNK